MPLLSPVTVLDPADTSILQRTREKSRFMAFSRGWGWGDGKRERLQSFSFPLSRNGSDVCVCVVGWVEAEDAAVSV